MRQLQKGERDLFAELDSTILRGTPIEIYVSVWCDFGATTFRGVVALDYQTTS